MARSQWSSKSQSDSDSDSSVELMGGMVSRQGRPLDRGVARTYSKGRRWQKMRSVTSGQKPAVVGDGEGRDFYFLRHVVDLEEQAEGGPEVLTGVLTADEDFVRKSRYLL